MSNEDLKTLAERVEQCEAGLTAVETILRATFPQFFEPVVEDTDNGDTETTGSTGEGSGEAAEETGGEEKASEETPETVAVTADETTQ